MKVTSVLPLVLKQFSFYGRTSRGGWWLINVVIVPVIIFVAFGGLIAIQGMDKKLGNLGVVVILVTGLVVFLLGISSIVRRYHDLGKSGWWILIGLIPGIGWIWELIECGFISGDKGENRFGPAPGQRTVVETQPKTPIKQRPVKALPAPSLATSTPHKAVAKPVIKTSKVETTGARIARQFDNKQKKKDPTKGFFK
jgi:uncharacterized membrane protein YhaH (DUF805 family)